MKIIQIVSVPQPNGSGYHWTYGLGDDNKMYFWHENKGEWVLNKTKTRNDY